MRNTLKFAALAVALGTAFPVMAQQAAEGNWMVRARAVFIDPANKSDAIPSLAVPSDAIEVSTKTIPELDISYFFTKNIAAELILTYPQKHDVKVTGSAVGAFNAGSFKHLPPTLTLQYHFTDFGAFKPYVGAGINYTSITADYLSVPVVNIPLHLENDSWGGALQAGFDYKIAPQLYLNFDVKYVQIRSDVLTDSGTKVSRVKVDPMLYGIGIGYRF